LENFPFGKFSKVSFETIEEYSHGNNESVLREILSPKEALKNPKGANL